MYRKGKIYNLAFDLNKQKDSPKMNSKRVFVERRRFDYQEPIVLEFRNGVYTYPEETESSTILSRGSKVKEKGVEQNFFQKPASSFSKPQNTGKKVVEVQDEAPCTCKEEEVKERPAERIVAYKPEETEEEPVVLSKSGSEKTSFKDMGLGDDDFKADLQAILKGEKLYDPGQKKAISASQPEAQKAAQKLKEEDTEGKGKKEPEDKKKEHPHAIFDKLSNNFSEAKTFDLGSIDLEKRFEAFDEDLHLEEEDVPKKSRGYGSPREEGPTGEIITDVDLVDDFDRMGVEKKLENKRVEAFSEDIPLTPETGGMSLHPDALEPGDIILSTTSSRISGIIRRFTNSEVSHAAVYIGNGKVIEAIEGGVTELPLADSISMDTVSVAFRHQNMTPDKAAKVVAFLVKQKDENAQFDHLALIKHLPFQVHQSICNNFEGENRRKCINFGGRVYLGTDTNNEFFCSELVVSAFEQAGLPITKNPPNWSSPESIVQAHYNKTLDYLGHLKTNI